MTIKVTYEDRSFTFEKVSGTYICILKNFAFELPLMCLFTALRTQDPTIRAWRNIFLIIKHLNGSGSITVSPSPQCSGFGGHAVKYISEREVVNKIEHSESDSDEEVIVEMFLTYNQGKKDFELVGGVIPTDWASTLLRWLDVAKRIVLYFGFLMGSMILSTGLAHYFNWYHHPSMDLFRFGAETTPPPA